MSLHLPQNTAFLYSVTTGNANISKLRISFKIYIFIFKELKSKNIKT